MKLEKVLSRFAAAPHDQAELRRLARALGNELPRERLDVLRTFRAEIARAPLFEGDSGSDAHAYARGYVASLLDVTAEYEAHVQERQDANTALALGIRMAVDMFRHLLAPPAAAREAGLMDEPHAADPVRLSNSVPTPVLAEGSEPVRAPAPLAPAAVALSPQAAIPSRVANDNDLGRQDLPRAPGHADDVERTAPRERAAATWPAHITSATPD